MLRGHIGSFRHWKGINSSDFPTKKVWIPQLELRAPASLFLKWDYWSEYLPSILCSCNERWIIYHFIHKNIQIFFFIQTFFFRLKDSYEVRFAWRKSKTFHTSHTMCRIPLFWNSSCKKFPQSGEHIRSLVFSRSAAALELIANHSKVALSKSLWRMNGCEVMT